MAVNKQLSFSSKVSSRCALRVTTDNLISICTEDGVYLLNPQNRQSQKNSRMVVQINKILCPTEIKEFDVDINREAIQAQISDYNDSHDDIFNIMLDRTVSPALQSMQTFRGFRTAQWSPPGGDSVGRSVLATLTNDHQLDIHSLENSERKWTKVVEVSDLFEKLIKTKKYDVAHQRLIGSGKTGANDRIDTLKERTYLLATVDLAWSPAFTRLVNSISSGPPESKKKRASLVGHTVHIPNQLECCYLVAALKNGCISLWRVNLPVNDKKDVTFCDMKDLCTDVPSTIYWCSQGQVDPGFVAVGYQSGLLKIIGLSWIEGSADLVTGGATDLWSGDDKLPVSALCWDEETSVLYMGKGPYLIAMMLDTLCEESEWKVVHSVRVTIGNQFPISTLHLNKPYVYAACLDDRIVRVETDVEDGLKLKVGDRISLPNEEVLPERQWKCHGIATSTNQVFLYAASSPMWLYCHLTMKAPLKFHIKSLCSIDEVVSLLLNAPPTSSLSDYKDAMMFIKHSYAIGVDPNNCSRSNLPTLFDPLIEGKDLWPHLSAFRNKVTRSLLQVKLAYCPSKAEDQKADLETDLKAVTDLILMAHIGQSISRLSMTFTKGSLTESETTILLLLGSILSRSQKKEDAALARNALQMAGMKGKTAGVVKEKCIICQADIPFTEIDSAACTNGHTFGRCCQTLLVCQEVPYRRCSNCGSLAIGKTIIVTASLNGLITNNCSLCDGRIV